MYKGEPHEMSKCRKKINLDVANFQPDKSTTQIWVTRHQYGISGLVLWTYHVGEGGGWGGETVVASGNVGFFISQATSFRDLLRSEPNPLCVKEDQRHLNSKSFSLGII